jgi:hypothetical protein
MAQTYAIACFRQRAPIFRSTDSKVFSMRVAHTSRFALACAFLVAGALGTHCIGQSLRPATCATFAANGSLATGILHDGEFQIKVDGRATVARVEGGPQYRGSCEEAFSEDGKWLAAVVPANELTILIFDRKARTLHQFSSDWHQLRNAPLEPGYTFSFLEGFLSDDSLALWRYVPRAVVDPSNGSYVDLHLQRWSVNGELLSDQNLGGIAKPGRAPISLDADSLVWIPVECNTGWCYRGVKISGTTLTSTGNLSLPSDFAWQLVPIPENKELLGVTGKSSIQSAVLLDSSAQVQSRIAMPVFPNLLWPLVPDWFYVQRIAVSPDGNIAAISRSRVAWVLVDTDRDWGSEIVLLSLRPLAVIKTVKTGMGGIGAIAVDNRDDRVRLIGFWKDGWHEMQYEQRHPGKWMELGN